LNSFISRTFDTHTAFSELLFRLTEDIQAIIIVRYPTANICVRFAGTPKDSSVLAKGLRMSMKEEASPYTTAGAKAKIEPCFSDSRKFILEH